MVPWISNSALGSIQGQSQLPERRDGDISIIRSCRIAMVLPLDSVKSAGDALQRPLLS